MDEKKLCFSAKNIQKHYGATHALKGVDLDVREGEIVGLVGENGAGKSTLLKIIIGTETQSSGEMFMHGEKYAPKNPMDANKKGVGMVFQEQSLIVSLTVGQNIFFGREKEFKKFGFIDWGNLYKDAQQVLNEVDVTDINPRKKVSDLNFATRQMIEIAKVMNVTSNLESGKSSVLPGETEVVLIETETEGGASADIGETIELAEAIIGIADAADRKCMILLDEPTSVLNEAETKNLFKQMRKIAAKGHAVVFVSHRLDEILEITDRIYVYKDGESVGSLDTKDATEALLYEMMVGRTTSTEYYHLEKQHEPKSDVVLEVKNLGLAGVFKDVSFQLHKGEILGVCGVVGSGKEDICEVLCGDEKPTSGEICIHGQKMEFSSPVKAKESGILMIPKERLVEGIVRTLSVENNIAQSNLNRLSKGAFVGIKKIRAQAMKWIGKLRVKTSGPKELLMQLSGGNQQKVVFSRALASECEILILNHPTRGVDVGAKEEIYSLIRDMMDEGKSVILLGDTLDECIGMSNRIIVMKDGLMSGEFTADADAKPAQVDVVSVMM